MPFPDLNDACKGLLVTTAEVLNTSGLRYVVAGGWVPILAEPEHPSLVHPGTRDVDVLMTDDPAAVEAAAKALLAARFRPSAKHEFQLLRDATVGARDFVFNIDLMRALCRSRSAAPDPGRPSSSTPSNAALDSPFWPSL